MGYDKLQDFSLLEQHADRVGGLCAVGEPLLRLFGVDLNKGGLLRRVIGADFFNETAVAGKAAVSYDNAVERALLGAQTAQTNLNHGVFLQNKMFSKNLYPPRKRER